MPQLDLDGANSKISADKIEGQSGTTVTVTAGHNLAGSGSGLTALPAANLTGTIAAISGANLTNLPVMGLYMNTLLWDTSTTGTQAITGVGFEPTHIFFVGNQANVTGSMSFGWYGPSAFKYHISDYHTVSADTWTAGVTYAQQDNQSGAGASTMEVTAVGADGFTLTKATSGSPSGTWRVNYIAWKVT